VADLPAGYRDISPEDQANAKKFFERGKAVGDSGNYDFAFEMYLQGLSIDPDNKEAHEELRRYAMIRKAGGGKDLGFLEKAKLRRGSKDEKQNLVNAARLLAYNPGDADAMAALMHAAAKAGYYDTARWMGPILMRANLESKSPNFKLFVVLKDVYKELQEWSLALDAAQQAVKLKPDDMDLDAEVKNLGALETMKKGNFAGDGGFQGSMANKERAQDLIEGDKDVVTEDLMLKRLRDAEAQWKADPHESGKISKYVDCLEQTEDAEHENKAIEILEDAYKRTKQFRFRQRSGKIKMAQMARMERSIRQMVEAEPNDASLKKDLEQFQKERLEFELNEYRVAANAYPSDLTLKYNVGSRLFSLGRPDEAISVLQDARNDPKLKVDAGVMLGKSFLQAGFVDEAAETLQGLIDEYQLKGDEKSKDMYYWQGRALEEKGAADLAMKRYSQVAQWEFMYLDVQSRLKALRAKRQPPPQA
jgi:tetratricopeptide (TPR) repeat protein